MLHEINEVFDKTYKIEEIQDDDVVLMFKRGQYLGKIVDEKEIVLPTHKEYPSIPCVYLFTIGNKRYFLAREQVEGEYHLIHGLRHYAPQEVCFAIMTGYHIHSWMDVNRFCGRCGKPMEIDQKEFMFRCPDCGNLVYPRINPAVNIAIMDGNKLLMAKHNADPKFPYALIAGFVEYGESLEDTIHREVMEEVGLKVKNIRYFGSQPWGSAGNLQVGFLADLDGSNEIHMDENEIKDARWFEREDVPDEIGSISVTGTMIHAFKMGEI